MKSVRLVSALFAMMVAGIVCAQDKTWPWDFPQGVKIEAEPGQKVLSCESFYFDDLKKGEDLTKSVLIWYTREMEQVGAEKSDVGRSDKQLVPNAMIVPLKKGDRVWATFVDGFRDGYIVKEVNEKTGHVWVQRDGRFNLECKSIAEVTKVLD